MGEHRSTSSDGDARLPLPAALPHGRGRLRRGFGIGVRLIAALLSLAVLLGSGYAWVTYQNFLSDVHTVDPFPKAVAGAPRQADMDGEDQNILLVGNDDRTGATPSELAALSTTTDGGGINTDTMMVLHVPADGSRATGISFPRDSWVNVPGYGMNKLNAAYSLGSEKGGASGGARLLITVIQNLTGLTIDHYVAVSMLGFYRIASVLGPIQVCLNQPAKDPYSGTDLPAGRSTLNASQALSFVRQRHNLPRGDLDREVRQQYFLSTEFRKLTSGGSLFKIQKLLRAVSSSITKDPGLDLGKFASQVQGLSAGNVTFATIPTLGTPTIYVHGAEVSIVAVNMAAIPGFVAKVIGRPTNYEKAATVEAATVSVRVVNGSGVASAGPTTVAALQRLGFRAGQAGNGAKTTTTTIQYPAGMESQAKTVAASLPGAGVAVSSRVRAVTILLGVDRLPVRAPGTAASSGASTPAPTTSAPSPAKAYSASSCIN